MTLHRVAVIGAGELGRRLAVLFAAAGHDVVLEDVLPSKLRQAAAFAGAHSHVASSTGNGNKLRFALSVEDAVRDADLVVDCVPDELESKLEIFSLLDRMAPPLAIFVTPTQHLSLADLASCTYRPERCLAIRASEGNFLEAQELTLLSTSVTLPAVLQDVAAFWREAGYSLRLATDAAEPQVVAGTLF